MSKPVIVLAALLALLPVMARAEVAAADASSWPGRAGRYIFEITRD